MKYDHDYCISAGWHATTFTHKKKEMSGQAISTVNELNSTPTDKWNGEKQKKANTNSNYLSVDSRDIFFLFGLSKLCSRNVLHSNENSDADVERLGPCGLRLLSVPITGDPWPNGQRQASGTVAARNEDTKSQSAEHSKM